MESCFGHLPTSWYFDVSQVIHCDRLVNHFDFNLFIDEELSVNQDRRKARLACAAFMQ